jgi:uncharacterized protein (TIGR02217 family)
MSKTKFYEMQFPTDVSYGVTGGPEFSTDIFTSSSGFEQRNINWVAVRNRYNLAPSIKSQQQLQQLTSFFRLCRGKAIGFRFKDWLDYKIENQQIAISDGEVYDFQLIKSYVFADHLEVRSILKPVAGTVKIYIDGKEIFPKIEVHSGLVKFKSPPKKGAIISVDAEFDMPVRFDIDHLPAFIENYGVYSHHEIPLVEIKL